MSGDQLRGMAEAELGAAVLAAGDLVDPPWVSVPVGVSDAIVATAAIMYRNAAWRPWPAARPNLLFLAWSGIGFVVGFLISVLFSLVAPRGAESRGRFSCYSY